MSTVSNHMKSTMEKMFLLRRQTGSLMEYRARVSLDYLIWVKMHIEKTILKYDPCMERGG